MDQFFVIISGLLVLTLISYLIFYNRVIKLEHRYQEASSGIDVALSKRFELITNLIEVVKGYAKHEKEVLSIVTKIRGSDPSLRHDYNGALAQSQSRLLAIAENYPDLKASQNFLHLQKSLSDCEEHLQAARRLMNRSAAELNTTINQFPGTLFNKILNKSYKKYFEAESSAQTPPVIEF